MGKMGPQQVEKERKRGGSFFSKGRPLEERFLPSPHVPLPLSSLSPSASGLPHAQAEDRGVDGAGPEDAAHSGCGRAPGEALKKKRAKFIRPLAGWAFSVCVCVHVCLCNTIGVLFACTCVRRARGAVSFKAGGLVHGYVPGKGVRPPCTCALSTPHPLTFESMTEASSPPHAAAGPRSTFFLTHPHARTHIHAQEGAGHPKRKKGPLAPHTFLRLFFSDADSLLCCFTLGSFRTVSLPRAPTALPPKCSPPTRQARPGRTRE